MNTTPCRLASLVTVWAVFLGVHASPARAQIRGLVNVKYFKELSNEATVEGHSLQISAGVTF